MCHTSSAELFSFIVLYLFYIAEHEKAVEMGQQLIDRHFGHNVKNETVFEDGAVYYRLLEDDTSRALNAGEVSECEPRPGRCVCGCLSVCLSVRMYIQLM